MIVSTFGSSPIPCWASHFLGEPRQFSGHEPLSNVQVQLPIFGNLFNVGGMRFRLDDEARPGPQNKDGYINSSSNQHFSGDMLVFEEVFFVNHFNIE